MARGNEGRRFNAGNEGPYPLKYAPLAPDVWELLGALPRAGWTRRGVEDPETVLEHTLALRKFVADNREELLAYFSQEDIEDILDMLEIHDWPEVYTGDITPHDDGYHNKSAGERAAMQEICKPLGTIGEEILALWERYETGADEVASFARQVDKLQAIAQAFAYEREGQVPVGTVEVFVENSAYKITHPFLTARLQWVLAEYTEWREGQE